MSKNILESIARMLLINYFNNEMGNKPSQPNHFPLSNYYVNYFQKSRVYEFKYDDGLPFIFIYSVYLDTDLKLYLKHVKKPYR